VDILDITRFTDDGMIREAAFFDKVDAFDWDVYRDKRVLVKGCGTTIIPPWAFMVVAARLSEVARVVKYGNEHSAVPVFRRVGEAKYVKD
jgi:hypothetical protein